MALALLQALAITQVSTYIFKYFSHMPLCLVFSFLLFNVSGYLWCMFPTSCGSPLFRLNPQYQ